MANHPPDDHALEEALPKPRAQAAEDGNFKRGRFSPLIIVLALVAVAGSAFAVWFFYKKDKERLLPEERAKMMQNAFVLPVDDQVPKWREWATHDDDDLVQEEIGRASCRERV